MSDAAKFLGSFGGFLVIVGFAATIDEAESFLLFDFGNPAGSEAPAYVIQVWEVGLIMAAFAVLMYGLAKIAGGR
jgi:hypothetical protein